MTALARYRVASAPLAQNPGDLSRVYFGGHIPESEQYRPYWGRSLDLSKIESAIVSANYGLMARMTDLGREVISLDGDVSAFLSKRLNRLTALDWDCIPANGRDIDEARAKERAAEVRENLQLIPNLRERFKDLAWAIFDGRAASEIEWIRRGRKQLVKDLHWIHPRRLSFGPDRDLRVIDPQRQIGNFRDVGFPLEAVPYKFAVYRPRLFGDYQEREGLCPRTLYWSTFKRLGTREQLELMEIFGKPWRILIPKLGQGQALVSGMQNVDAYEKAFTALTMLGFHNTARMPPGVDVQIVQPQQGAGQVHSDVIAGCRDVLSKLYLGGVATTDAISTGLGSSIGDIHLSEEDLIIAGDAHRLAEVIEDQLTDAIIVANYGPSEIVYAPRFVIRTDPPTDREKEAGRIKGALDIGLRIAEEEARERLGFRAVRPDEPYLLRTIRQLEGAAAPVPGNETVWPAGEAPPSGEMPDLPDVTIALPPEGAAPPALPGPNAPPQLPAPGGTPPAAPAPGAPPAAPGAAPAAASDAGAARLAQQMTELGATQCAHGKKNRCRLCGVERDYSVELDDSGEHVWPTAWKAIGAPGREPSPGDGLDELDDAGPDAASPMDDEDDEDNVGPVLTRALRRRRLAARRLIRVLTLAAGYGPPSESGSHWHTLDREHLTTAVDGEHTHFFQMPDGTLVQTATGGKHQHRYHDDDCRWTYGGAHLHALTVGEQELWTQVDGQHEHELQVTATTQSGMHGHCLVLPDGATIESLRTSELAEILEGDELGMPLTYAARQQRKLLGLGLTAPVLFAAATETVNGSTETLVARGVDAFADVAGELGEVIADRVEGKTSGKAIRAAIKAATKAWDRQRFADVVERELLHGLMLGALDAAWEAQNGKLEVTTFAELHAAALLLKRGDPGAHEDPAFAKRPQTEAVQIFIDRNVVTRDTFDQMSAAAQRRAFTVANAATEEIARAVQRELVKQIAVGAELADFKKHALGRLQSAGWTPQNASHVETVFRTNVSTAYNSGRARQMTQPVVLSLRPYWQILGVGDGPPRERATHAAANNLVLRADDPFWRKAYPPFGYNCRHRVRSLSKAQGESIGITDGSTIKDLPDPGFTSGLSSLIGMPSGPIEVPATPTPGKALDPVGTQAHLQERGATVDEATARQVGSVIGKVQPNDVDAFLAYEPLAGLGGTPTVSVTSAPNAVRFATETETPSGERAVVERTFVKRGNARIVRHDKLILSDGLQGRGLGKRIMAAQLASYERLGLDAIELDASWTGTYFWPKLGFDVEPAALASLVSEFEAYLIRDGYSDEAAAAMTNEIESARDVAVTMAGDRQVGKDFLLEKGHLPGLRMPLKGPQLETMKRELGL